MAEVITRFAPSPNGLLHAGHAYSALFAARYARERGGIFLLRIEDIDFTRARDAHVRAIFEDLSWLGLRWPQPVRFQSRHVARYCAALKRLRDMGVLYPCHCTRKRQQAALKERDNWPRDPQGAPLYPGLCRPAEEQGAEFAPLERPCARLGEWPLKEPLPPAWRLNVRRALHLAQRKTGAELTWREEGEGPGGEHGLIRADAAAWGDVILGRRDIGVSYHIAVVVDDAEQGVTHVTRGQDLFHATAIHRLLQVLLDLPEPAYVHHRLITDEQGRKLSKSAGDISLRALRRAGMTAKELISKLGFS